MEVQESARAARLARLTLLDQKSGWRHRRPRNHAAGMACNEYHSTCVACAVQVPVENKRPRIDWATIAVDYGLAVNPLLIEKRVARD